MGQASAASNAAFFGPIQGLGIYSAQSAVFPGTIVLNSNTISYGTAATHVLFNFSGYTTNATML